MSTINIIQDRVYETRQRIGVVLAPGEQADTFKTLVDKNVNLEVDKFEILKDRVILILASKNSYNLAKWVYGKLKVPLDPVEKSLIDYGFRTKGMRFSRKFK